MITATTETLEGATAPSRLGVGAAALLEKDGPAVFGGEVLGVACEHATTIASTPSHALRMFRKVVERVRKAGS